MLTNKIFRIILLLTAITAGTSTKIMPMGSNNNTVQEITAEDKNQLKLALENGNLEVFTTLYKKNPNILQIKNNLDLTPLHFAFQGGHLNIIKFIYDLDKNHKTLIDLMNAKTFSLMYAEIFCGHTPLHLAFQNGHLNIIEFLFKSLNSQTFISLMNAKTAYIYDTPLHLAFYKGHLNIIEFLLKSLNPQTLISLMNAKTDNGFTPLHIAFYNGHEKIIEFLLKSLNPQTFISLMNAKANYDFTPLHFAFQNGHLNIIKFIYDLDENHETLIDLMNAKANDGGTPLHFAFLNGHLNIIKFIYDLDENHETFMSLINNKANNGGTPLHFAFKYGHLNIIEFLLKSLNPQTFISLMNAKANDGYTPLHSAFEQVQDKVIKFIYDKFSTEKINNISNKIEFSKKLLSNNKLLEFILNKIKEENNGELKLDYLTDKNGDTLVSALSKNPECLSKIILDNFNPYIDPDKDEIDKLLNPDDTKKNSPVGILIYETLKYCKCNIDKTKNFFSNIMYKIQELFMSEEAIDKEKIKNKNNKNFINNLVNNAMVLKLLKKWIPQQTFTNNYANTEHSEKIPCCTPLSNDVLQEHIMGFAGYTCFDNPKNKKVIEILRSKDFNDSLINKFANNDTSLTFFPENKIIKDKM